MSNQEERADQAAQQYKNEPKLEIQEAAKIFENVWKEVKAMKIGEQKTFLVDLNKEVKSKEGLLNLMQKDLLKNIAMPLPSIESLQELDDTESKDQASTYIMKSVIGPAVFKYMIFSNPAMSAVAKAKWTELNPKFETACYRFLLLMCARYGYTAIKGEDEKNTKKAFIQFYLQV